MSRIYHYGIIHIPRECVEEISEKLDKDRVILAQEFCPDTKEVKLVHIIPRESVLEVTELRGVKK